MPRMLVMLLTAFFDSSCILSPLSPTSYVVALSRSRGFVKSSGSSYIILPDYLSSLRFRISDLLSYDVIYCERVYNFSVSSDSYSFGQLNTSCFNCSTCFFAHTRSFDTDCRSRSRSGTILVLSNLTRYCDILFNFCSSISMSSLI